MKDDQFQEILNEIKEDLKEIKHVLTGNPVYKSEGLIDMVQKNTKFRESSTKKFFIVTGIALAISLLSTFKDNIINIFHN